MAEVSPHALEAGLKALSRRELSRAELMARLERSGIDAEDAERASSQLTEAGYQSDERTAAERARVLAARLQGDLAIRVDLRRRGHRRRRHRLGTGEHCAGGRASGDAGPASGAMPCSLLGHSSARATPTTRSRPRCGPRAGRSKMDHDSYFLRRRTSKNRDLTTKTSNDFQNADQTTKGALGSSLRLLFSRAASAPLPRFAAFARAGSVSSRTHVTSGGANDRRACAVRCRNPHRPCRRSSRRVGRRELPYGLEACCCSTNANPAPRRGETRGGRAP